VEVGSDGAKQYPSTVEIPCGVVSPAAAIAKAFADASEHTKSGTLDPAEAPAVSTSRELLSIHFFPAGTVIVICDVPEDEPVTEEKLPVCPAGLIRRQPFASPCVATDCPVVNEGGVEL
jgi:hypothetical protein